jgi:Lrp/AsnC family transcriptional regulator, leucine-responsive regulatory protein
VRKRSLDDIDRRIIGLLRRNGRASFRELGDAVGLSPNAAAERVRQLVRDGVITRFTAEIEPGALGRELRVLMDVSLREPEDAVRLTALLPDLGCVTEALHATGDYDYHLRLTVTDPEELDRIITRLKREGGVRRSSTRIVLTAVSV